MLVSLKTILGIAEAKQIAVGAFNVTGLEGIRAVIEAAESLQQPVILQFANSAHNMYIPLDMIGPIMVEFAERSSVPVCVHLDHGNSFDEISAAIDMGFSGVMYDGSALPYEENVANTRAVVEISHKYGISVEAEIGSMGNDEAQLKSCYTEPEDAARFVEDTDIDALACSFGTVHGIYLSAPKLDIERIGHIKERCNRPIVMHGGSGISDEDFRRCIKEGVRKINFYTYAAKYAGDAVRDSIIHAEENVYFHDIAAIAMNSMTDTYKKTIKVFSNL